MPKIYLDSCIVIYLIQGTVELQNKLAKVFSDEHEIYISGLTCLECKVLPYRNRETSILRLYDDFFMLKEVNILTLETEVFEIAAMLRAKHHLKTPDAIHLAAALHSECDQFWTNDYKIPKKMKDKLEVVVPV